MREVRNGGRLLVDVGGRALEIPERDVSFISLSRRASRSTPEREKNDGRTLPVQSSSPRPAVEVDLHGLTVEEALTRVENALNDALLADVAQVRFIHGRSGGRIRAALHRRLAEIASVRHYRVDPRNEGVTIVEL